MAAFVLPIAPSASARVALGTEFVPNTSTARRPATAQSKRASAAFEVRAAADCPRARSEFVSRRTALAGIAAALAAAAVPSTARAADGAVVKAITPVVQARQLLDTIPGLIEAEGWDKVRTILKNAPVGKLEQIISAAADLSEDPTEVYEEMDLMLAGLRDADNNFYLLAVQFPNEENKRNFLAKARNGLERGIKHLDAVLAYFNADAVAAAHAAL